MCRYLSNVFGILAALLTIAAISTTAVIAQEERREFLKCLSQCTDRKPPKGGKAARFPENLPRPSGDGFVSMFYDVTAEGRVTNLRLEKLFGRTEFAESALKDLAGRRYEPATENAAPIAYHGVRLFNTYERILRTSSGKIKSGNPSYAAGFLAASDLEKAGNYDDALAELEKILLSTDGNIYSYFAAAYSEAAIYAEKKNPDRALYYIRLAVTGDGKFLSGDIFMQALQLQFVIAASSGQDAEALTVFDTLKKNKKSTNAQADLAAKLETEIAGTDPVKVQGWVYDSSFGGAWRHELFRRKFDFDKINGKLDHFELYCDGRSMTSAMNETSAWVVPPNWSGCEIYVLGDAGATFQFYEQ